MEKRYELQTGSKEIECRLPKMDGGSPFLECRIPKMNRDSLRFWTPQSRFWKSAVYKVVRDIQNWISTLQSKDSLYVLLLSRQYIKIDQDIQKWTSVVQKIDFRTRETDLVFQIMEFQTTKIDCVRPCLCTVCKIYKILLSLFHIFYKTNAGKS